jgi:hypothetical protein
MKTLNPSIEIWKTIKLGTGLKTAHDARNEIKRSGCSMLDFGSEILGKPAFTTSDEEIEVDLVIKSVAEIGFANGATRKQIYERAIGLGLQLCPAEVGPQLRLQYLDQPKGECLHIAMDSIVVSGRDMSVLYVDRPGSDSFGVFYVHHPVDRWLSVHFSNPDTQLDADYRSVFKKPRK